MHEELKSVEEERSFVHVFAARRQLDSHGKLEKLLLAWPVFSSELLENGDFDINLARTVNLLDLRAFLLVRSIKLLYFDFELPVLDLGRADELKVQLDVDFSRRSQLELLLLPGFRWFRVMLLE